MTVSFPTPSTGAVMMMAASAAGAPPDLDQVVSFETSRQDTQKKQYWEKQWTWAVAGTSSMAILTGLIAMYVEASIVCYIAFLFPLVLGPAAIIQRRRLNRQPTLVQEINLCRQLVNRMTLQNDRLTAQHQRLTEQVSHLQQSEAKLEQIATTAGMTHGELQRLCRENAAVQKQMKQLQQAAELQRLLSSLLSSDTDHDRHISEAELDRLLQRLQIFSNSARPIDDGLVRQAFHMSGASAISTTTLFRLTTELMEEGQALDRELDIFDMEAYYENSTGWLSCRDTNNHPAEDTAKPSSSSCNDYYTTHYARCTD